ncbi:hypothetical protein HMN09_00056500 [Mycena chlorophos]|uniref:TLC domain-containing protein n=1 Tax=Mycena chlorophos TaxID=658473 RepID=A0A8H6WMF7_MYCCL|nr:hypothetical protein HMN09_00056500 [Mycena chlorophos]
MALGTPLGVVGPVLLDNSTPQVVSAGSSLLNDTTSVSVAVASFVGLCAAYGTFACYFETPRQAAWILTTLAGLGMTLCCIPFVRDYATALGSVAGLHERSGFAIAVARAFQGYLAADLIVGINAYRSQITLLTGWIHHSLYLVICEVAIRRGWAHLFAFCGFMELPTFLLGIGTLFPQARSNRLFTGTFFTTRILMHTILIAQFFATRPDGSLVPALVLCGVFPLHVLWFVACIKGIIRRVKARRLLAPKPPHKSASLRLRVRHWFHGAVRESAGHWVSNRRPFRPRARAMARRMGDRLVNAKEVVMEFVGFA